MEPTAKRWDDPGRYRREPGVELAAMEPTAKRWDDKGQASSSSGQFIQPQWSPPLSGGTTRSRKRPRLGNQPAAMEPTAKRWDDPKRCPAPT